MQQRLLWLNGGAKYDGGLVERTELCAQEVWCELLKGDLKYYTKANAREINGAMRKAPGWAQEDGIYFSYMGKQRGFRRTGILEQKP